MEFAVNSTLKGLHLIKRNLKAWLENENTRISKGGLVLAHLIGMGGAGFNEARITKRLQFSFWKQNYLNISKEFAPLGAKN